MLEIIVAAVAGLIAGSFLNVCIHRLPREQSVWSPARSFCPHCEKTIAWFDNLPLLSFLMLRGKCRHCGSRISLRYPAVELLTALLFAFAAFRLGASGAALKLCIYSALMVGLLFSDLEERILPDEFTIGGTVLGIVLSLVILIEPGFLVFFLPEGLPPRLLSLANSAFAAVFAALSIWVVGFFYEKIRKREGLGFGDVKMVALMGSFYGLMPTLLTLMIGSLAGALIGIGFIVAKGYDARTYELPFGTFLAGAAIVVAFFML
jgi:leader peptidase (prepilin peptidase)/N-methyltransferase